MHVAFYPVRAVGMELHGIFSFRIVACHLKPRHFIHVKIQLQRHSKCALESLCFFNSFTLHRIDNIIEIFISVCVCV